MRTLLTLTALLALLSACASPSGGGAADSGTAPDAAGGGISQADDDLQVEVDPGDGTEAETWTLSCLGLVDGSHPDAQTACADLEGMEDPFAPLPSDVVCTEQYGGPQTAHVLGRWNGEPVDLELSLTDGCRIAQWQSLSALVPLPVAPIPAEEAPPS